MFMNTLRPISRHCPCQVALPLYRQSEKMAAQGVNIDRSALAGWAGRAAHLLDPIVTRIREEGLKAAKSY